MPFPLDRIKGSIRAAVHVIQERGGGWCRHSELEKRLDAVLAAL
jgi:hypothetical protein